jgi:hypothetical protein
MAAIICPSCGEFLAEEGDLDYDSVANLAEKRCKYYSPGQGAHRVLVQCFACNYIGDIEYWE